MKTQQEVLIMKEAARYKYEQHTHLAFVAMMDGDTEVFINNEKEQMKYLAQYNILLEVLDL